MVPVGASIVRSALLDSTTVPTSRDDAWALLNEFTKSPQLIKHGRSAETPVAVIRWGTYEHQETYISNLAEVAVLIEHERVASPAIIVVGEVVRLREQLQWFAPELLLDVNAA